MLVGHPDAEELAREIIERGLNVREVEAVAQATTDCARKRAKTRANAQRDTYLLMLEKRLSDLFGLELSIEPRGEKGVLRICYTGLEQLDNIAQQLERSQQKGRSDTSAEDESTSMGTKPGGLRGEYPAH